MRLWEYSVVFWTSLPVSSFEIMENLSLWYLSTSRLFCFPKPGHRHLTPLSDPSTFLSPSIPYQIFQINMSR